MKVKIKKVKSPLKKYRKIIQEVKEDRKKSEYRTIEESTKTIISQLITKNELNHDMLADAFDVDPNTYTLFLTNQLKNNYLDEEYLLNQFSLLFRCNKYDLIPYTYDELVTDVPKWADTVMKLRIYLLYNKIYLKVQKLNKWLQDLWWNYEYLE